MLFLFIASKERISKNLTRCCVHIFIMTAKKKESASIITIEIYKYQICSTDGLQKHRESNLICKTIFSVAEHISSVIYKINTDIFLIK